MHGNTFLLRAQFTFKYVHYSEKYGAWIIEASKLFMRIFKYHMQSILICVSYYMLLTKYPQVLWPLEIQFHLFHSVYA